MIDAHVHVGWFIDHYHSPEKITSYMRSARIDTILVSSTSTCAEEYDLVIEELLWLKQEWGDNLIPSLWITPTMIENNKLNKMLTCDIDWKVVKLHWKAHPQFYHSPKLINIIMNNERLKDMPVLLHTGLFPECKASIFTKLIEKHPQRVFILAHGRPIDETIQILSNYNNVFVDTAFMPICDIITLVKKDLTDLILWGSDCPINLYFNKNISVQEYISCRLNDLRKSVDLTTYEKITEKNFQRIFSC